MIATLLASTLLLASGEVWRTPTPPKPAEGPSSVELKGPDGSKGDTVPTIGVFVHDRDQKPIAGLAVAVKGEFGSHAPVQLKGATGSDGKFSVNGQGKGVSAVTMSFTWDDGAKTIRARLDRGKKGWEVDDAPYVRILDGKDDGSCKNLFAVKPNGPNAFTLDFRQPLSLLGCEEISYGTNRKTRDLADIGHIGTRDVNRGDKNGFSPADEAKMGLEASTEFDKQFEQVKDPAIVGYVQSVLDKVVAACDKPNIQTHLRVVNTDDVNAFVTAGGNVYVFTGLIKMAENESELAGVLAHETSHAIARHVTEGATRNSTAQTGAQLGAAAIGALLGAKESTQALVEKGATTTAGVVTLHYDRNSEAEADLLGEQYLWKAGWDPEAIAHFFELMQEKGMTSSGPNFLSTHPSHEKRVQNGILWARAYLPPKDRYLVDTAEFQAAKAKVMTMKAPAKQPAAQGQKSLQQLMSETPTWKGIVNSPPPKP